MKRGEESIRANISNPSPVRPQWTYRPIKPDLSKIQLLSFLPSPSIHLCVPVFSLSFFQTTFLGDWLALSFSA